MSEDWSVRVRSHISMSSKSFADIAEALGVHLSTFTRRLSSDEPISIDVVMQIAEQIHVNWTYMYFGFRTLSEEDVEAELFPVRLKGLLEGLSITPAVLSSLCWIDEKSIKAVIEGKRLIKPEELELIAKTFNVAADDLLFARISNKELIKKAGSWSDRIAQAIEWNGISPAIFSNFMGLGSRESLVERKFTQLLNKSIPADLPFLQKSSIALKTTLHSLVLGKQELDRSHHASWLDRLSFVLGPSREWDPLLAIPEITMVKLTRWISGEEIPRFAEFNQVASFLSISPTWLVLGVGEAPSSGLSAARRSLHGAIDPVRFKRQFTVAGLISTFPLIMGGFLEAIQSAARCSNCDMLNITLGEYIDGGEQGRKALAKSVRMTGAESMELDSLIYRFMSHGEAIFLKAA